MDNSQMNLVSELRDLKIKVINNELDFSISKKSVRLLHDELKFISHQFSNDIITGSIALKLFGLIHESRHCNDIDILIKDKNRYSNYYNSGGDYKEIDNRLGYKSFKYKKNFFTKIKNYNVDFFHNTDTSYIEFNYSGVKLKVHNPIDLMTTKLKMCEKKIVSIPCATWYKHESDLVFIFNLVNQ